MIRVVWFGVVWKKGRKERAGRKVEGKGRKEGWKRGGKEEKGRMEEGIEGEEGWENWK